MTYRRARSLDVLMREVDTMAPKRSKASDGWIGDAAHATRDSDHNPWLTVAGVGVVTAQDITDDPLRGCSAAALAERFRSMGRALDGRVKYVIWNHRIASARDAWSWRPYSGSNPHTKHVHLSVSERPIDFDATRPWGIAGPGEDPDMQLDDKVRISDTEERTVAFLLRRSLLNAREQAAQIAALTEAVKASSGGGALPADFDERVRKAAAAAVRNTLGSLDE